MRAIKKFTRRVESRIRRADKGGAVAGKQTGPEAQQSDSDFITPGGPQAGSSRVGQPTQALSEQFDSHAADQLGNVEPVGHLSPHRLSRSRDASRPEASLETSTTVIPLDLAWGVTGPDAEIMAATHAVSPKRIARGETWTGDGHDIAPPRDTTTKEAKPGGVAPNATPSKQDEITPRPMSLAKGRHLWTQAYQAVKADPEFSSLLDKHQETLKARQIELHEESVCPDQHQEQIQTTAKGMLDTLSATHFSFLIGKRTVVVQEQVQKLVKGVLACKDVIGAAIAAEPHAALVWASVLVVLPVLERIFQQDEDAADGFSRISFLLLEYRLLEDLYLSTESQGSSDDRYKELVLAVEEKMVSVYAMIYRFQIRIILHYARGKLRQKFGNATTVSWKTQRQRVEDENKEVEEAVGKLFANQMVGGLGEVRKKIGEGIKKITDMQKDILDATRSNLLWQLPFAAHAAFDSIGNSQEQCMQGTQREPLDTIQKWVEDPDAKPILWLRGMAGTGKSSITQTVATWLDNALNFMTMDSFTNSPYLGASFFFKHDDDERNDMVNLIPTIARTLAARIPALKEHIINAVRDNPNVGMKKLPEQIGVLLLEPLSEFGKQILLPIRLVLLVDALDECSDQPNVKKLLELLPKLQYSEQVQVRILITSRPENHIQSTMPRDLVTPLVLNKIQQTKLGDDNPDDITLFVTHELRRITEAQTLRSDWISAETTWALIEKADGLFIYAATMCRFLDGPMGDSIRNARVERILQGSDNDNTDSPEKKIAEIYIKVLSFLGRTLSPSEKTLTYATVRKILGVIALVFEPVAVIALSQLLEMESKSVLRELEQLHSIVSIPKDTAGPIGFFHLSFRDYLLGGRSKPDFWVDEAATHDFLFHRCLKIMESDLGQDMCDLRLPGIMTSDIPRSKIQERVSSHLQYSCLYWVRHFAGASKTQSRPAKRESHKAVYSFLCDKFLYWLEALSLIGKLPASILMINDLQSIIDVGDAPDLSRLLQDARRFMLSNRQIIEQAPLQTYCSALLFSPMDSVIRNIFQRLIPEWIVRKPVVEIQWSPEILTLEGHTDVVASVAMSPCDNIVASGSYDGTTRLWDMVTGAEVLRFKDPDMVTTVAFSPDGKTVASGLWNGSIQLREFAKGETTTLKGSSKPVRTVSFSLIDNILASTSDDKTLRVWNVDEKRDMQTVEFEDQYSWPLAFSPNGRSIVIGYGQNGSGGVMLWDVETKIRRPMVTHDGPVFAVTFSADGKKAASRARVGCLKVWDAETGDVTSCVKCVDLEWQFEAIAFSPADDHMVAAGLENGSIVVCNTATPTATVLKVLPRASPTIRDLAFSMDGEFLASGSADCMIHVWDMSLDFEPSETEPVSSVQFLPRDQNAVAIWSLGRVRFQDTRSESKRRVSSDAKEATFSQDGSLVALIMSDRSVQFWDPTMTEMIREFDDVYCYDVTFSNDSSLVVLQSPGRIRVLSTKTWEDKASFQTDVSRSVALSPTNQFLAWMSSVYRVGVDSKQVTILHLQHLETDEELWALPCHLDNLVVTFSPDGELLVCQAADLEEPGSAVLLEVVSGKRRAILEGESFIHVAFNAESSLVAIGGSCCDISVSETATGSTRHILRIDAADDLDWYVDGLQFSPLDQIVASSFKEDKETRRPPDWTIQLWDGESGDEVGVLPVDAEVSGLSFSDDCTHLVSWNGRIPLPRANRIPVSDEVSATARNCLYVGRHWVVQGFENLVWLPPAYRVKEGAAAVRDEIVVLGHQSGLVTSFEFDLGNTPLRASKGK